MTTTYRQQNHDTEHARTDTFSFTDEVNNARTELEKQTTWMPQAPITATNLNCRIVRLTLITLINAALDCWIKDTRLDLDGDGDGDGRHTLCH